MDEKKRILRVIEKPVEQESVPVQKKSNAFAHPNQTNPIYKNMAKFVNEKIGEKFSLKDLLR